MAKVEYRILYRNGTEDVHVIEIEEVGEEDLLDFNKTVERGFKEDLNGILTLGDGESNGIFVRLTDVIRVELKVKEGD